MNKGVLDIGNTRIKAAVFSEKGNLTTKHYLKSIEDAYAFLLENEISSVMISSTASHNIPIDHRFKIHKLNQNSLLPFKNLYDTPQTLGTDRIAAMAAAFHEFPNQNVLVFDFGTCITIDFLNDKAEYRGGNISPGINLRFRALDEMTGLLPLSKLDNKTETLGNNTLSAIANGVFKGIANEIEGYIQEHKTLHKDLKIVFTGGDSKHFEVTQKNKIFANPDWTLIGLYHLLIINEK
jgi:type III pantothenate kinase